MDALIMCGGNGTRFDGDGEKPLYPIDGVPMIERIVDALGESQIKEIRAAVSPNAPDTTAWVRQEGIKDINTPGNGYVSDLNSVLHTHDAPMLTVSGDMPLLTAETIDTVVDQHDTGSLTVYVPVMIKRNLGLSVGFSEQVDGEDVAPAGINIVSNEPDDVPYVTKDYRYAVNVNTRSDARVAEHLV